MINKIDIIQSEFGDFDIITLNETWLDEKIDSQSLLLEGYQEPFRKDRKTNRYGGVMIYLKNQIPSRGRLDLEIDKIEGIWIECEFHSSKVLIGTFYRPPNSDIGKWDLTAFSIEKAKDTGISNIIVTGDFNDNLHEARNSKLLQIIQRQGMHQLITKSTHFTESTDTLLDLLIVNNLELIEFAGVGENILPSSTRFHCPIFGVLKFQK
jgi:exonuclease III